MIRSPRSRRSRTYCEASPACSTSSSILRTRVGAPPCSGPERAPTAADMAALQSAPVDATILPVKEDALRRNVSFGDTLVRHARLLAASRLRDERDHPGRKTGQVVAGLLVRDVDELTEAPEPSKLAGRGLQIRHCAAGEGRKLDVFRTRHPRIEGVVHEQAPDLLVGHLPD